MPAYTLIKKGAGILEKLVTTRMYLRPPNNVKLKFSTGDVL